MRRRVEIFDGRKGERRTCAHDFHEDDDDYVWVEHLAAIDFFLPLQSPRRAERES